LSVALAALGVHLFAFTPAAVKEATSDVAPPIDLSNGEEFAEQPKELGLGVQKRNGRNHQH
jgi:hypothetical protein